MSNSANIRAAENYLRDAVRMLSSVNSVPSDIRDEIQELVRTLHDYDDKGHELRELPKHSVVTFQKTFPGTSHTYTYCAVKFRENEWRLSTGVNYDSAGLATFIGKDTVKVGVKWERIVLEGQSLYRSCNCESCRRERAEDPNKYANEGAPFEHPRDETYGTGGLDKRTLA